MTVRADPPPKPVAMLRAIDEGARDAANEVRRTVLPAVRAGLPAVSGRARRGTVGRVSRTATGYTITIAPSSRVRYPSGVSAKQVVRFLHTGTGIYGPRHRPIKPRRAEAFHLPSGWRTGSIRGQRGTDYFGRSRSALTGTVYRTLEQGAVHAARAAERAI